MADWLRINMDYVTLGKTRNSCTGQFWAKHIILEKNTKTILEKSKFISKHTISLINYQIYFMYNVCRGET